MFKVGPEMYWFMQGVGAGATLMMVLVFAWAMILEEIRKRKEK